MDKLIHQSDGRRNWIAIWSLLDSSERVVKLVKHACTRTGRIIILSYVDDLLLLSRKEQGGEVKRVKAAIPVNAAVVSKNTLAAKESSFGVMYL